MDIQVIAVFGVLLAGLLIVGFQTYKNYRTAYEAMEEKIQFESDRVDAIEYMIRDIKPNVKNTRALTLAIKQYEHAATVGKILKREHEKPDPNFHLDALNTYIELNFDTQLKRVVEKSYKAG